MNSSPVPGSGADPRVDALLEAVRTLSESHKSLMDSLRAPERAIAASTGEAEIRRIIAEALREQEVSSRRTEARDRYIEQHMRDLPDAYRRQVPQIDDPAELARAERDIRLQFREDLKRHGVPQPQLSGSATQGSEPGAAVDYSRLSPLQQIALGLSTADAPKPPVRPNLARATEPGESSPAKDAALPLGAD